MIITGFDFETALIRPGLLAPPPVCCTWYEGEQTGRIDQAFLEPDGVAEKLEADLKSDKILVAANAPFDVAVAMERWPSLIPLVFKAYDEGRIIDVQINQMLIDNARGQLGGYYTEDEEEKISKVEHKYNLADIVKRTLGYDISATKKGPDVWRLRYWELRNVPLEHWPEDAVQYALDDSVWAHRLMLEQIKQAGTLADSAAQSRAALALHLLSCWGIKTSPTQIEKLRQMTEGRFKEVTKTLVDAGLVRASGSRDTKAARLRMVAVMAEQGRKAKLTKTGLKLAIARKKEREESGVQTDAPLLTADEHTKYASLDEDACNESGDELLERYAERTSLANVVNNHIPDLYKGTTTPIQASFNVLVASGRVSCRKGTILNGYQLTNPARAPGIRECFTARLYKLLYDNDFSMLELHTWSQACIELLGYSAMAEALNAGIDVHLDFGAQMLSADLGFTVTYEDALANKDDPEIDNARQAAKPANFGFPGGMGARGFVSFSRGYGLRIGLDRAGFMREVWVDRWQAQPYFNFVSDLCRDHGVALAVEQLFTGRIRGLVPYTAACNGYFQGLGADCAKTALYEVCKRSYDPTQGSVLYGSRPVNFVHDQILGEVDGYEEYPASRELVERASAQAEAAAQVMVDAANLYLKDVPVRCAPSLCKVWSKKTKPVFDRDKNIVAWDLAKAAHAEVYDESGRMVVWK